MARNRSNKTKTLLPLVLCFGFASGHGGHHIRLVILLALGLAGMFMMHMLAQDFNKIHGALTNAGKLFNRFKRHDILGEYDEDRNVTLPDVNWAKILSRDPTGCARSLVCQLAAVPEDKRGREEVNILTIVEITTSKDNWANRQMKSAFKLGKTLGKVDPNACFEKYSLCPYSSKTMLTLLRFFGGTKAK